MSIIYEQKRIEFLKKYLDNEKYEIYRKLSDSYLIEGYFLCIGLEIHAQIKTKTKLFSRSLVNEDSQENSNVDLLDAGMPGSLPIPNKEAIFQGLKTSLALNMKINQISIFDRKHYFYQDSPLGYQITQYFKPIGYEGYLNLNFGKININRLHIESDAGKSIYENGKTYIDLNRVGIGLMEIVTEPEFTNADEVIIFLKELRAILIEIDSSNADMEKGNFRVDVNISINKPYEPLGTRVEIKNLNSFQSIKKAIEIEFKEQKEKLSRGEKIIQSTKLFNVETNETKIIRSKEDFEDYGYFPDPDLLPILITNEEIEETKNNLPILPSVYKKQYLELGLTEEQINIIMETKTRHNFFKKLKENVSIEKFIYAIKAFCSDILGSLIKLNLTFDLFLNEKQNFYNNFQEIINLVFENKISKVNGKNLLIDLIYSNESLSEIIEQKQYLIKNNYNLTEIINNLINQNPKEIEKFKKGNSNVIMFFVGAVMKETKGSLDPITVKEEIIKLLNLKNE